MRSRTSDVERLHWAAALVLVASLLPAGEIHSGNRLWIDDQSVIPGQEDVWFPVRIANEVRIQGFQLLAVYDPSHLSFVGHSLDFTVTRELAPEFLEVNSRTDGTIEVGCIFEWTPPFDDKELSPGDGKSVLQLRFDVRQNVFPRTISFLDLVDDPTLSRIRNIFTVDGQSVTPELQGARIYVRAPAEAGRVFVRGDVNDDGAVEFIDALLLLNYLFQSGPEPSCLDALDFADEGWITLTSALNLLNYLFLRGPPPSPPFPNRGLDSTDDDYFCAPD